MMDKINELKDEILKNLEEIKDLKLLEELETKYLGRKGEFTQFLRNLVNLSPEEKKKVGGLANETKRELMEKFAEVKSILTGQNESKSFVDTTLPGKKFEQGHLHPITIVQRDLEDLFASLGFVTLEGPELESEYYNFEVINIPSDHPARDTQDTFFIDKTNKDGKNDLVLRTHTSSVQVRAMEKYGVPIACVIPGRVFRCEATDVRHEHTFYQFEGLMVGENITFANMQSVLETVNKYLFGQDTKTRFRPKFYPFVEPGVNGEVTCFLCKGEGCRLCKHTGWLEILGAGMVHPNVLRAAKVDPDKYQGFAFGYGLNRIVQLKYGIEDCRLFNSGDLRFLEQF